MQYKSGHTLDLFLRYTRIVLCAALTRLNKEKAIDRFHPKKRIRLRGKCVMRNDVKRGGGVDFMTLRSPMEHLHCFVLVHLLSRLQDEETWEVLRRWLVRGA